VTLLGLMLYAVIRVGTDAFYDKLAVVPDEVGVGDATLIGHAAVSVTFLLVALPVVVVSFAKAAQLENWPGLRRMKYGGQISALIAAPA
jgi:hypothetical protein